MGSESNLIDHLFRSRLAERTLPLAPDGWAGMEQYISKRNRLGGPFMSILLPVIVVSGLATAYLIYQGASNGEDLNQPLTVSYDSGVSSSADAFIDTHVMAGVDTSQEKSSWTTFIDFENKPDLEGPAFQTPVSARQELTTDVHASTPSLSPGVESTKEHISGAERNHNEKTKMPPATESSNDPEVVINPSESGRVALQDGEVDQAYHSFNAPIEFFQEEGEPTSEIASFMRTQPGSFNPPSSSVHPPFKLPGFRRWSLQATPIAGYSNSTFKGDESNQDYVRQRDEQELGRINFGAELSIAYDFGRMRANTGLQYFIDGEKLQYSGEMVEEYTYDSTIVEYITESYMDYDTTTVGGLINIDSTLVTTIVDSTQQTATFSGQRTVTNASITSNNGLVKTQHVILPLRFSYAIRRNMLGGSWWLQAGADIDYVVSRRVHYLSPDRSGLQEADQMGTYRKVMISGIVGLEYDRNIAASRYYFIVNPYFRTNLGSWNSEFVHRYKHYGLRFGIGMRL